MKPLSDLELGYAAGLFDGEGSSCVKHCRKPASPTYEMPTVAIASTTKPLIDWVDEILEQVEIKHARYSYQSKVAKYQLSYHLDINGPTAVDRFFAVFGPYLKRLKPVEYKSVPRRKLPAPW